MIKISLGSNLNSAMQWTPFLFHVWEVPCLNLDGPGIVIGSS